MDRVAGGPEASASTVEVGPLSRLGVNLTSIGVTAAWWIEAARAVEDAGLGGVYSWDHFISRGRRTDPVLECWTTLTAAAVATSRLRVGSLVSNVMNRHPAVLARATAMLAELAPGRVDVALGLGGHPREHKALGIPFPNGPERLVRLEEALRVLRLLWSGGPVDFDGRHYPLHDAFAFPRPDPAPRLIVGAAKPGGVRAAARLADGWTADAGPFLDARALFEETVLAAGRQSADLVRIVTLELDRAAPADQQPLLADLGATVAEWRARGADEVVLSWVKPEHLGPLLESAGRVDGGTRRTSIR